MLPLRPKPLSARKQQNQLVVAVSNAVIVSLASSIEDTCIRLSYAIAPFEKPAKILICIIYNLCIVPLKTIHNACEIYSQGESSHSLKLKDRHTL